MHIRRKPKLIAGFFIGGTTLLIGGAALAASLSPSNVGMHMLAAQGGQPTTASVARASTVSKTSVPKTSVPKPTATAKSKPATSLAPRARKAPAKAAHTVAAKAPLTYTVRRGDTLFGIAAWFKLHGYGDLYSANAKVIGADPNLIHPGERITIGSHVMKMQGPA